MSKKKPDPAVELAGEMIRVLESRRTFDSHPTLQELGEMSDGAASPDLIVKAATKKPFTERAVVVRKLGGKPALDGRVYFKGEEPSPAEELSRHMLAVLEQQVRLGPSSYPLSLRQLAELCRETGSEKILRKAAATSPMAERAIVAAKKGLDAPVVLRDDVEEMALGALLRFALSPVKTTVKKKLVETMAFTPKELAKRLVPDLQDQLEKAARAGAENEKLPAGISWVIVKGEPLLFLSENLQPAALTPSPSDEGDASTLLVDESPTASSDGRRYEPGDFAGAFQAAFEILDRRNGSTNFVKLADLRQLLAEFRREEFDAGLRELRMAGDFSLDSHEGLHGTLSEEEREAGVREAGSLLIYASRR